MTAILGPVALAPKGSTGNNTHTSARATPDAQRSCVLFVVEAVGATPTVTYKAQGSMDLDTVADGSANWFDLMLLPNDTDTAAKTFTVTATGAYAGYLCQAHTRFLRRIRVVSSSNTNVTYRAELHQHLAR